MNKSILSIFLFFASVFCAADAIAQSCPSPTSATASVTFRRKILGAGKGDFSVSYSKKVVFSQGNLQFRASADGTGTDLTHNVAGGGTAQGTWRFAEHQYDFVGDATVGVVYQGGVKCNNKQVSSTYTGWIDLFRWATSGWDNTENDATSVHYQPYSACVTNHSTTNNPYQYGPSYANVSAGQDWFKKVDESYPYKNYDWGVYNAISNGGNEPGKWRTLTREEWYHLLCARSNNLTTINDQPYARCAKAKITVEINEEDVDIYGLIIFPDNYAGPTTNAEGITWGTMNVIDGSYTAITLTTCTEAGWTTLENAGCVFLPRAGYSNAANNTTVFADWNYWTATSNSSGSGGGAYSFKMYEDSFGTEQIHTTCNSYRYYGCSVRLVQDIE